LGTTTVFEGLCGTAAALIAKLAAREGWLREGEENMSDNRHFFSRFATSVADLSGKPTTFVAAVVVVLAWAIAGPFFGFSDTWELVINTGTTIITFLMVFVLQNSQNRDGKAMQAKLDELILASKARNEYVGIEKLDEKELKSLIESLDEAAKDSGLNSRQGHSG